jgi:hypothetical protein
MQELRNTFAENNNVFKNAVIGLKCKITGK